ncbi:MAG: PAS domain-containing protein [Cyclobacteriaceae bacterium]
MPNSLQNNLTRLERILDATTEGWWELNLDTDLTYCSPGWFRMMGLEADTSGTFDKQWWNSRLHPDDKDRVIANQKLFIQQDEPWEQEFRMLHIDGDYVWILSRGKVLQRSPDGRALLVGGLHINITPQKQLGQLNESLKMQERLVQGILKVSLSSVTMIDFIAKRMSFTSGKIMKNLGYREDEFAELSQNFYKSVIHIDDLPALENHISNLIQSNPGQVFECLLRFCRKEGGYNTLKLRDSVFARDHQGYPQEVICSAIDITQYLNLKAKMDDNMKFIKEMSFKNSHEMRAPVATLLGLAQLMKLELYSPDSVSQMIDYLEQTVKKMDEVIRDLTDTLNEKMNRN